MTLVTQVALWQGRKVLPMRPEHVGGMQNVLAVAPMHVQVSQVIEEPAAVLMRLPSEYMVTEWVRRLRHSAAQMHSVASWQETTARSVESVRWCLICTIFRPI